MSETEAPAYPSDCADLTGIGGMCCPDCHPYDSDGVIDRTRFADADAGDTVLWGGRDVVVCCIKASSAKRRSPRRPQVT